jgi:hypothetical protein
MRIEIDRAQERHSNEYKRLDKEIEKIHLQIDEQKDLENLFNFPEFYLEHITLKEKFEVAEILFEKNENFRRFLNRLENDRNGVQRKIEELKESWRVKDEEDKENLKIENLGNELKADIKLLKEKIMGVNAEIQKEQFSVQYENEQKSLDLRYRRAKAKEFSLRVARKNMEKNFEKKIKGKKSNLEELEILQIRLNHLKENKQNADAELEYMREENKRLEEETNKYRGIEKMIKSETVKTKLLENSLRREYKKIEKSENKENSIISLNYRKSELSRQNMLPKPQILEKLTFSEITNQKETPKLKTAGFEEFNHRLSEYAKTEINVPTSQKKKISKVYSFNNKNMPMAFMPKNRASPKHSPKANSDIQNISNLFYQSEYNEDLNMFQPRGAGIHEKTLEIETDMINNFLTGNQYH